MKRHIREPWIAGQCHLNIPGDVNSWQPEDDDNDGEFTGSYLAMESFRYAATNSADARKKAKKAFAFLKMQEEITGGDGYFARSIVPIDWLNRVHDNNLTYTAKELADEMVKEPRFKPVEVRWRNPWAAVGGNPDMEREPVFWLLPYWMGRYLKMIQ